MTNPSLIYLLARARAVQADSVNQEIVDRMLDALSLAEIKSILEDTVLAPYLQDWDPEKGAADQFELALRTYYGDLLYTFMVGTDNTVKSLIKPYLEYLELENVKIIMKALYFGWDEKTVMEMIAPSKARSAEYFKRILDNESYEIAPDYVLFENLRQELINLHNREKNVQTLGFLSDLLERKILENLPLYGIDVSEENFFRNVMIVLRALQARIDLSSIPFELYPSSHHDILQQAQQMETVHEAFFFLSQQTPIGKVFKKDQSFIPEDPYTLMAELERSIQRYLVSKSLAAFSISLNPPKSLIGFINLKRTELEDVARIVIGKSSGIPQEKIRSTLVRFA